MKKEAEEVTQAIRKSIKELGLDDKFHTIRTKCIGRCDDAPVAMLSPENIWLKNIDHHQCQFLIQEIQGNQMKNSGNFLYQMGELTINSDSIPTKYRKQDKSK